VQLLDLVGQVYWVLALERLLLELPLELRRELLLQPLLAHHYTHPQCLD
jgi:hypothetical protein